MPNPLLVPVLVLGLALPAQAADRPLPQPAGKVAATQPVPLDSKQMELTLQSLPWPQFRSVIEGVPKLKAEVEAHGSLGWTFVQSKYKKHGWKKNIDRLDDEQKRLLAELIGKIKKAR